MTALAAQHSIQLQLDIDSDTIQCSCSRWMEPKCITSKVRQLQKPHISMTNSQAKASTNKEGASRRRRRRKEENDSGQATKLWIRTGHLSLNSFNTFSPFKPFNAFSLWQSLHMTNYGLQLVHDRTADLDFGSTQLRSNSFWPELMMPDRRRRRRGNGAPYKLTR